MIADNGVDRSGGGFDGEEKEEQEGQEEQEEVAHEQWVPPLGTAGKRGWYPPLRVQPTAPCSTHRSTGAVERGTGGENQPPVWRLRARRAASSTMVVATAETLMWLFWLRVLIRLKAASG